MSHFVTALKGVTLNCPGCPVLTKILRPKLPKSVASRGTGDGRRVMATDGRQEMGDRRWETGDGRKEAEENRQ